jgi:CBS domain-containing protein
MNCPSCEYENVAGADSCEKCGTDMLDSGIPRPGIGMQARILSDPLSVLGPWDIVKVSPEATVAEAIAIMRKIRHGSVLIVDRQALLGIFTERDLLMKIVERDVDPEKVTVAEVMTKNPTTLKEDDPLAFAIHLMAVRGFRHIPIMRNGVPQGVVSIRGVLQCLTEKAL